MGSRRTSEEKSRPRKPARHVWVWPTPSTIEPMQGVVIVHAKREGVDWCRVAYVSSTEPPTLIDTWLPARLCVPIPSTAQVPNY